MSGTFARLWARMILLNQQARFTRATQWVSMLLFALIGMAVVTGALEFAHYNRLLTIGPEQLLPRDKVLLFFLLWAKSLLAMLPLLAATGLCAFFRWRRTAWVLFILGSVTVTFWLVVDVRVHAMTNLHVLNFATLLRNPDATDIGGGFFALFSPYVLPFLGVVLAVLLMIQAAHRLAHPVTRWLLKLGPKRGTILATSLFVLPIVVIFPAQRLFSRPILFEQLEDELPMRLPAITADDLPPGDAVEALRRQLTSELAPIYRNALPRILTAPTTVPPVTFATPASPNVLVIVLESWRADAFAPEFMPRLYARAAQGMIFQRHYAGANNSHPGLFSLLFSRYPLTYHQTLDQKSPALLPVLMRRNGYHATYLATAPVAWERMDEYLNLTSFDRILTEDKGAWPGRDQRTLAHVRDILRTPATQPRFVFAFLMSTHFPYEYPPEYEVHRPAATAEMVQSSKRSRYARQIYNRYMNAAGFLDQQIDALLADLDLSNTIVLLTGDHGESLFDDGYMAHGSRLSDAQTRVPLAIFGPGVPRQTISRLSSHIDILPTLAHLLHGQPVAIPDIHGRDLLDPAAGPDQVMIFQLEAGLEPFMRGALIQPDGRMLLKFFTDPRDARLQVLGPADARATLDLRAQFDPAQTQHWRASLTAAIDTLAQ